MAKFNRNAPAPRINGTSLPLTPEQRSQVLAQVLSDYREILGRPLTLAEVDKITKWNSPK